MIFGLDIGTSKVVAIAAEITESGAVEIIGYGSVPSKGMRKGMVTNIDNMVDSIRRAVGEAQLMSGCTFTSVRCGIAGEHIKSSNSKGSVTIRDHEVKRADLQRVIDVASAVQIPPNQRILHVLPRDFVIDKGQLGVRDPVGMSGGLLEADVYLVQCSINAEQNIIKCVEQCGLVVERVVLEQLASSCAVLTDDEKELGVCLVDIGGGTTDIAVFYDGAIRHTAVIPIAGDQVTNDIAVALHTATDHAEELKIKYACAVRELANPDDKITVTGIGGRVDSTIARDALADVIQHRYEELFELVRRNLQENQLEKHCCTGIVLTGGSAKIEGLVQLAESVFDMQTRIGSPQRVMGVSDILCNPIYATSIGLLLFEDPHSAKNTPPNQSSFFLAKVWHRIKQTLSSF